MGIQSISSNLPGQYRPRAIQPPGLFTVQTPISSTYSKSMTQDPSSAQLRDQALKLGEQFYQQSHFTHAIQAFDIALSVAPQDYVTHNKRGVCKAGLKDYQGARADYDIALRLRPDYYNAWINRGNLYAYMKDYNAALADYGRAIQLRPLSTVAYENRSELYADMQRKDLSLQDRARVIQLHRLNPKKALDLPSCPYRIALVLGNDDYTGTENDLMGGPVADTRNMQRTLQQDGFEVMGGLNLNSVQMQQKVAEFIQKVWQHPGAVTVVYYSGHGGSINGNNYMLPTDYDGTTNPDFQQNAVSVDYLLKQLKGVPSLFNIMILDACRNPLTAIESKNWEAEPRPGLSNTWIEYASRPEQPALQNNKQGIYTKYLLQYLKDPTLSLQEVFMLASYALELDPLAQRENQHARSQTDISKTGDFANSFYPARPCAPLQPQAQPSKNPFKMVSTLINTAPSSQVATS